MKSDRQAAACFAYGHCVLIITFESKRTSQRSFGCTFRRLGPTGFRAKAEEQAEGNASYGAREIPFHATCSLCRDDRDKQQKAARVPHTLKA